MKWITEDLLLIIFRKVYHHSGGFIGVRKDYPLESSIKTPLQQFNNVDLYPTIIDKISAFTFLFIQNHPLLDGNKRVGIVAMLYLLKVNNIRVEFTQKELINLALDIAQGNMSINYISILLYSKIKKGNIKI